MPRSRRSRPLPDAQQDWIDSTLDAADASVGGWRRRAIGGANVTDSMRVDTIDFRTKLPAGEHRLLVSLARARGLGPTTLLRMLAATYVIDVEGVPPGDVPWLAAYGTLGGFPPTKPWREAHPITDTEPSRIRRR